MEEHDDKKWIDSINQSLDESVQGLDAETRSQLNQIRQNAIAIKSGRSKASVFSFRSLSVGSIAVAVAVLTLWVVTPTTLPLSTPRGDEISLSPVAMSGEMVEDLLEDYWQEDPELMEELEFVAWLVDEEMMNEESSSASGALGDRYAG
ncbi:MAG: hypothetical protein JKY67_08205 [Pseudomonadales bacterium]|nr:hypothetical protein [Pseudomonadales bacterium]